MAVKPKVFARIPAMLLIDAVEEALRSRLGDVVQGTYYRIATQEWGQKPDPQSPFLVPTQAELLNDAARKTNDDAALAFLRGLRALICRASGDKDGEWFISYVRDECLAEIHGQPVFIHRDVELMLYVSWAENRVRQDRGHKNLRWGFESLPSNTRQYDRRIGLALWSEIECFLEEQAAVLLERYEEE